MATTFGNPRLRSVEAPLTPAEQLQELATPAQMQGRFVQLQEICDRLGVSAAAIVVRLEGLDRLRDEVGFGAPLGALSAAAEAVRAQLRQGDEFGRWSDDEIAVLCPGADADSLRELAAALAATVEQVRVRHLLQEGVEITLPLRASVRIVAQLSAEDTVQRHLHVA
jgi:GGDEF domain-containing protein